MSKPKTKKNTKNKAKKRRGNSAEKKDIIMQFLADPAANPSDKEIICELLHLTSEVEEWTGKGYTPPGSLLDKIVRRFEKHTDVSLDLPFFIALLLLSGILVRDGVTVSIQGNKTEIAIWLNLLCDSGAGKSYCLGKILESLQKGIARMNKPWSAKSLIWGGGAKSTAQFMREWAGYTNKDGEVLEESRNRSIMIIDEATDFFSDIKNPKSLRHDMYAHLLMAYGHESISHNTVSGGKITVEHPVISFLGLATPERFIDQISEADIEGGFYYRWANKRGDASRSMVGHAIYPNNILDGIEEEWKKLVESIAHQEYIVSDAAIEHFKQSFDAMVSDESGKRMPRAYIRRTSWLHHKLALLYHLLLGCGGQREIGVEPYLWAERLSKTFTDTAAEIIQEKMHTESRQLLARVEKLIARRAENGQDTTARDIVVNTKISTRDAELYLKIARKPLPANREIPPAPPVPVG